MAIFDDNNVNKQSILEKSLTTRQGCRKDIFDICTSSSSIMGRQEMSECLEKLSKVKKMLGYNANFLKILFRQKINDKFVVCFDYFPLADDEV